MRKTLVALVGGHPLIGELRVLGGPVVAEHGEQDLLVLEANLAEVVGGQVGADDVEVDQDLAHLYR